MLGIDAATSSGWGVIDTSKGRRGLLSFGAINAKDAHAIIEVVESALALGVADAAIETPYVTPDPKRANPDTAIKLGVIVGRWVQELDRAGIPCTWCKAVTWQQGLLAGLIRGSSPREVRKRAAKTYVRAEFGIDVEEDPADAICVAIWRGRHARIEERIASSRAAASR